MITRRTALKNLALTAGAFALSGSWLPAQNPAADEGVFKLPPLGYDYDALEPFIDAETMKLHHDKHHAAYVSKLNQAISNAQGLENKTVEELLVNLSSLPEEIRADVRNHGGGHANHTLLWQSLKKNENGRPGGDLAKAIDAAFGNFEEFQKQFSVAAGEVFGSGWTWLVIREGKLLVESTQDQDSPLLTGGIPLLGFDVWEHAYYLKYQNRRSEYLEAFQNVICWETVCDRYSRVA